MKSYYKHGIRRKSPSAFILTTDVILSPNEIREIKEIFIACRNGASLSAYFSHFCGTNRYQSSGILSPNEIKEIKEMIIACRNGASLSAYFSHFCGTNLYQSPGVLSPNEIREL